MAESQKMFDLQTRSGEPVTVDDVTITPESQALSLRWPGGGLVWNRPVAILVERDGETERMPILDVTLLAQIALLGLSLVFSIAILILSARRRRV